MKRRIKLMAKQELKKYNTYVFFDDEFVVSGDWNTPLGNTGLLTLDIGMGCGRALNALASRHPEHRFIGLEMQEDRTLRAAKKARILGLTNIVFIQGNATKLLEYGLLGCIDRILLNFSDPWPKRRHEKRRLTGRAFLDIYRKLLNPDGVLAIRTDNQDLFEWSLAQLNLSGWRIKAVDRDSKAEEELMTEFELRFRSRSFPICFVQARPPLPP
jgi:tRNA (guanine-N7-)-methyltransferase